MLVPLSWLRDYIKTPVKAEKLAEDLLFSGTKVEKIKTEGKEIVFELEITPNRPDTLSVLGIAREVAAINGANLKLPETDLLVPSKDASGQVLFTIKNKKLCPYYSIVRLKNVKVAKSPSWLREYLKLAGIRDINNVVDITNFVMLELGQPMHAFDADKIAGQMLLRSSKEGEYLETLDGQRRRLPNGAIVIQDKEKIIDLAGLMGGANSEVDADTQEIILLVPIYESTTIRQTSLQVNLRTEASNRFEKKLDPNMHQFALNRAVKLLTEETGAQLASRIYSTPRVDLKKLEFDKNLVKDRLGIDFSDEQIMDILSGAGFILRKSQIKDDYFEIQIPSFRTDISIAEDILEELGRLYGYNKLPKTIPQGKIPNNQFLDPKSTIRNFLLRNGFNETTGYTLISKEDCQKVGFESEKCLKVRNPASSDFEYLRPSLILNGLAAIAKNQGRENLSFFEISKTFSKDIDQKLKLPRQTTKLMLITNKDLSSFKSIVTKLLEESSLKESLSDKGKFFSSEIALAADHKTIGNYGKISSEILRNFDINDLNVFAFEAEMAHLAETRQSSYQPIPKYPGIKEDISFFFPENVRLGWLIKSVRTLDQKIYKVALEDLFEKDGKRSATLSFVFLDQNRTLESKEIAGLRSKIEKLLENKFKVKLRKG